MQPRRDRLAVVGETVFHVTKRGDRVMETRRWEVRRGSRPTGLKGSGVVAVVEGAREDVDAELGVEDEEGEELLERPSRCRTGRRRREDEAFCSAAASNSAMSSLMGGSGMGSFRFGSGSGEEASRSSSRPLG